MNWRMLFPLGVFLVLAAVLASGLGKDPRKVPSPLIGKPAPQFDLPALKVPERRVTSLAYAGKPYLVNVWGSWCVACREEHETLMNLSRSGLLPIVGLNWKDARDDALRWLELFGDPYNDIAVDADGRMAIDFGVYGAPESFLIDGTGTIRHKFIGPITPKLVEDELKPRLAAMTRGKP